MSRSAEVCARTVTSQNLQNNTQRSRDVSSSSLLFIRLESSKMQNTEQMRSGEGERQAEESFSCFLSRADGPTRCFTAAADSHSVCHRCFHAARCPTSLSHPQQAHRHTHTQISTKDQTVHRISRNTRVMNKSVTGLLFPSSG